MVTWPVLLVLMSLTMPDLPVCTPPRTLHRAPSLSLPGGLAFISIDPLRSDRIRESILEELDKPVEPGLLVVIDGQMAAL